MYEVLLATTSTEGLRPLGTPPQRAFELVTGSLRDRLGPRHAALFAEPVATPHGDRFDWYAPMPGKARRLTALDPAEAEAARTTLATLATDIREVARTLGASKVADDLRLAEALENALEVPDEDHVFVVRDGDGPPCPVLVNWAWVRDEQRAVRGVLTGPSTRPPPAPPPPPAAARAAPSVATAAPATMARTVEPAGGAAPWWALIWLGWLLLALMAAAILWMTLPACGLRGLVSFCPGPPAAAAAGAARAAQIGDEIALLERRIAEADRACQPIPAAVPVPPPAPEETDIDRRLDRAGAQRGELAFSLAWDGTADLDLHVRCPSGEVISYRNRAACGGTLDVDANAQRVTSEPVENVFFDGPGPGAYQLVVNLYRPAQLFEAVPFRLQLRSGGEVKVLTGNVDPANPDWTTTYEARAD